MFLTLMATVPLNCFLAGANSRPILPLPFIMSSTKSKMLSLLRTGHLMPIRNAMVSIKKLLPPLEIGQSVILQDPHPGNWADKAKIISVRPDGHLMK